MLVVAAAGFYIYSASVADYEYIFPNVYVAGVNVGGMSKIDAAKAVNDAVNETYSTQPLTVELEDRTLTFSPEQTKAALNTDGAIDEAWNYGREGNVFQVASAYRDAEKTEHYIELTTNLSIDTDYIHAIIDEAVEDVASVMKESAVTIDQDAGVISVAVGTPGRSLDGDRLYDIVLAAFKNNDFTPIQFAYDQVSFAAVDLDTLYRDMCVDKKDAYYDEQTRAIVPEVIGFGFDLEAAKQQLALAEEGTTVQIPFGMIQPEVTAEELDQQMFGEELASYSSWHTAITARTNNLKLACAAIDGTVLNPGDVFSFNNIVGERTADKGYLAASVYVDGNTAAELGGGVCQVASTIHMCALKANLEIVERTEHMFLVDYVPAGMDATIYWGALDYKFRNSTSNPMKISANVADGMVHITFTGVKENDYRVELYYETLSTTEFKYVDQDKNEIILSEDKATCLMTNEEGQTFKGTVGDVKVTAYTGYKIMSYRNVYDENGTLVSSEKTYSNYSVRDKMYEVVYDPEPFDPNAPVEPEIPEEPDVPVDPEIPEEPDAPVDPEDPGTTDPGATDPGTTDPGTTDPGTTDPGTEPTIDSEAEGYGS